MHRHAHESRPPQIEPLLRVTQEYRVEFVLTGSVAALAYGVVVSPGDLDITPAMTPDNLDRLAALLDNLEAAITDLGHWTVREDGERKFVPRHASPEELATWRPDVARPETFDHLFHTRLGNFDVVPEICGTYEQLLPRAHAATFLGLAVRVAHLDDLLAALTVPRQPKHRERVLAFREMQRHGHLAPPSSPAP